MTPEQYDRWKDFARRMARTCFNGQRRPSPKWILKNVNEFFGAKFDDADSAALVESWDNDPTYLCDHMSDFEIEHENAPGYWRIRRDDECRVDRYRDRLKRRGLDHDAIEKMVDELEIKLEDTLYKRERIAFDQWATQWMGPVRCCVRAGLDVASEPSAGVIGFSVGDLRKMYPEGIPEWLHQVYNGELVEASDSDGVWL